MTVYNYIINLTPHRLIIHKRPGDRIPAVVEQSGLLARIDVKQDLDGVVCGDIPVHSTAMGSVSCSNADGETLTFPEPQDGTVYITSLVVAQAVRRRDVLSPGPLVRDDDGYPIGCLGLSRHA